ncbi:MAG: hypothetical protein JNL18_24050 [Planctomycetaceae bacterium]|nr:hypothetical protein [Planctomycetaceae bacterium]
MGSLNPYDRQAVCDELIALVSAIKTLATKIEVEKEEIFKQAEADGSHSEWQYILRPQSLDLPQAEPVDGPDVLKIITSQTLQEYITDRYSELWEEVCICRLRLTRLLDDGNVWLLDGCSRNEMKFLMLLWACVAKLPDAAPKFKREDNVIYSTLPSQLKKSEFPPDPVNYITKLVGATMKELGAVYAASPNRGEKFNRVVQLLNGTDKLTHRQIAKRVGATAGYVATIAHRAAADAAERRSRGIFVAP